MADTSAMSDPALVLESLEWVAGTHGDPAAAVYTELFAAHPDLEALFVMDTDASVRGSMLASAIETILARAGGEVTPRIVLSAMRLDHEGYGVPADAFGDFFLAIRNVVRRLHGGRWTPEHDRAWACLVEDLRRFD